MLKLYHGGAEIPGWKKRLATEGIQHVALSFLGLKRRVKNTNKWPLVEKFDPNARIFLDSGAYSINTKPEDYGSYSANVFAKEYIDFVALNIERLDFFSEFDALILGQDRIQEMRDEFIHAGFSEKLMVVWHPEFGVQELERLAGIYQRIGIPRVALGERDLIPLLNRLAKNGVKLHGIAMTKPDVMREVEWDSVSSTSWLSPAQYGDTIVWNGKEIRRAPRAYKEEFRKKLRSVFLSNGFDVEKIEQDDSTELLRLALWSWTQLVADINRHRGEVVSASHETASEPNAEVEGGEVGISEGETRKNLRQVDPRDPSEMRTIPGLNLTTATEVYTDEDGINKKREISLVGTRSDSQRQCSNCFLSAKCPAYKEGSNCAYNIPIVIKTRDQFQALQSALIEMQTQRVLFMRMVEDMEGGYVDANLSGEIDRLQRLMKVKNDMDQEGFSLTIRAQQQGSGQTGLIGRLFGSDASESARALPAPIPADDALRQMGVVIDAEIVD